MYSDEIYISANIFKFITKRYSYLFILVMLMILDSFLSCDMYICSSEKV